MWCLTAVRLYAGLKRIQYAEKYVKTWVKRAQCRDLSSRGWVYMSVVFGSGAPGSAGSGSERAAAGRAGAPGVPRARAPARRRAAVPARARGPRLP